MFTALLQAGGNVNNPGNDKCGKYPIDHAIQHQRLDSVQVSEMSVRVGMRDQWRIYIVNFERAPSRSNFLHFIQFSGNFGRNNRSPPGNPGSAPGADTKCQIYRRHNRDFSYNLL